jgi:hypothetical protein
MVEPGLLPVALVVTGLALLAFLTLVLVVLLVTGDALGLGFFPVQESGVTGLALDLGMLATQRVFRIAVVIEANRRPVFLDVAGLALVAETALVALAVVVLAVAGNALRRRLFPIQETAMAGRAFGEAVFAAQRVFGVLVVVERAHLPVLVGVAGLAFVAEAALVALAVVVLAVTGDALRRRTLELGVLVAVAAAHIHMLAG